MEITTLKVDSSAEIEGVWFDVPEFGEGVRFLVARLGNPRYEDARNKAIEPHLNEYRLDSVSTEDDYEIMGKVIGETILLGWNGLTENGDDLPYSKEKAVEFMSDMDWRLIRDKVQVLARKVEARFSKSKEDALKNSVATLPSGVESNPEKKEQSSTTSSSPVKNLASASLN